jgi:hypothetical protein
MYEAVRELNKYLRGWVEYFRIQEFKLIFGTMDRWIRSRLRSMQLAKWKKPKKFQRVMISRGFAPAQAHRTWVAMRKWKSVYRREVSLVLSPRWFRGMGLVCLDDFTLASTS